MRNKDCKDCINCDGLRGFMAICHYSYDTEEGHVQVGQDVHRNHANKCGYYTTEPYHWDKIFVL